MMDAKSHRPIARWRERLLGVVFGVLLAIAGSFAVISARPAMSPPPVAEHPVAEPAGTAQAIAVPEPECYLGVVLASEAVDLVAETEGRLEDVAVRAGSVVEQGATIAVLDTQTARQQLAIERSMIAVAAAEERRYGLQVERADQVLRRRLGLGDLVSAEDVDIARYQRDVAQSALDVAVAESAQVEARIAQLESALARAQIQAPFTGTVALRYLDAGAVIRPGTPIVRLISSHSSLVRFAVPPETATSIRAGTPIRIELAGSDKAIAGTVEHRAPEIDAPSQMVFVEARLAPGANDGLDLAAGAVARISTMGAGEPPINCLKRARTGT